MGCTSVQTVSDEEESYLELDVEPANAQIYLDGDYHGTVDGWHHQVVPVEPGARRVELRAHGYITQRFDIDVPPGRWLTLRVRMERSIESLDDGANDGDSSEEHPELMPPHPNAP